MASSSAFQASPMTRHSPSGLVGSHSVEVDEVRGRLVGRRPHNARPRLDHASLLSAVALGNGIPAVAAPRVASADAPKAEPSAADGAVHLDRLEGVRRTRRLEPTGRRSAGAHALVGQDHSPAPSARPSTSVRPRVLSRRRREGRLEGPPKDPRTARGRTCPPRTGPTCTRYIPGFSSLSSVLMISRSRRRSRLRTTAEPQRRPTA